MKDIDIKHKTKTVKGVKWHWVEAGEGDPIVLIHGIPESWKCWQHQIPKLATQFKVYAIDLKGYGQSDKSDGDYTMNNVASEVIDLLNSLAIENFRLAGHDWGVAISDNIIDQILNSPLFKIGQIAIIKKTIKKVKPKLLLELILILCLLNMIY